VIRSFRHRSLKRLYKSDDRRGLPPEHVDKLRRILARLDEADEASAMDLPGFRLHPLKGDLKGFWSVRVSANWRIIFRLEDGHAWDVELTDYH
jgi:toxin HigB-1